MAIGVHHVFEIVQVQEDHRKLPALCGHDIADKLVQLEGQVAGIVIARDLVDEGAGLELLQVVDVVHRNGHVIPEDFQEGQVLLPEELLVFDIDHFKDTHHLPPHQKGQGNDGPGIKAGDIIHLLAEALIAVGVINDDGLPGLGHGAGNTLPHLEAHAFQKLLLHAHGDGKIKLLGLGVQQQQRPVAGGDEDLDALQHRGQESFHVIDADQGFGEFHGGEDALHLPRVGHKLLKIFFPGFCHGCA